MTAGRMRRAGLALLVAFVLWACVVVAFGPGPVLGEAQLLAALEASRSPERTAAVRAVTTLGGWSGQLPLLGVAGAAFVLARRREAALSLAGLCGAGFLTMSAAKLAFGRPRPDVGHAVYQASGLSFPSGHATASMFFFLGVGLLAHREGARWPLALLLPLALVVGLTRPYLGVHYPSDVLGGWLLAAGLTLVAASRVPPPSSERPRPL